MHLFITPVTFGVLFNITLDCRSLILFPRCAYLATKASLDKRKIYFGCVLRIEHLPNETFDIDFLQHETLINLSYGEHTIIADVVGRASFIKFFIRGTRENIL